MAVMHQRIRTFSCLLALGMLAVLAPGGAADEHGNQGTIKVHDGPDADPDQRNEPHVGCDFFIEGFGMADGQGHLVVYDWPPTGDKNVVLNATWTGTPDDHGFHFLAGPFSLPDGHYRVEVFGTDHPGQSDHFAKAKMFWVDCESVPECPPGTLSALTLEDGAILLQAELEGPATLLRGDDVVLATLEPGNATFVDFDTEVGATYTYVLQIDGNPCDLVEATSIPVFGGALASGLAIAVGALGYAVARRR